MGNLIRTFSNEVGTWYCGTRERLIHAGLATSDMFPQGAETWRGNGPCSAPGELTWAVHRTAGTEFLVMWGTAPPPACSGSW